jgi:hypothetical protein
MYFKQYDEQVQGQLNISVELELATDFIARWGLIACVDDGEDSAGRKKFRLATPVELTERAVQMVEALISTAEAKGWIKNLGPLVDRKVLINSYGGFEITRIKDLTLPKEPFTTNNNTTSDTKQ